MITSFHIRNRLSIALILMLFAIPLLSGCGSSPVATSAGSGSSGGSTDTGTGTGSGTGTDTSTTFSGPITVSGTLSLSDATSLQSLSLHATTPAHGYSILATNVETGAGTRAATSQGAYELTVTKGQTYVFVVFDSNNRFAAVITGDEKITSATGVIRPSAIEYVVAGYKASDLVESQSISGVNATLLQGNAFWTGTKVAKQSDVGKLTSQHAFIPVDKYAAERSTAGGAAATGGESGNFGKGATTGTSTGNAADLDGDGIPNALDPDADGNGIPDALEGTDSTKSSNDRISGVFLGTNYNPAWGSVFQSVNVLQAINLHVGVNATAINKVTDIRVIAGPSLINTGRLGGGVELWDDEGVPSTGWNNAQWSTKNFRLFRESQTNTDGSRTWSVQVYPDGLLKLGDAFTIQVTYSDSRIDTFTQVVDFAFSEEPIIVSLNSVQFADIIAIAGGAVIDIPTSSQLAVVWQRPRDESGNEVTGLRYSVIVSYGPAGGGITHEIRYPRNSAGTDHEQLVDTGTGGSPMSLTVPIVSEINGVGNLQIANINVTARPEKGSFESAVDYNIKMVD